MLHCLSTCLQVTYSSKSEVLSTFTRDYESLKSKVSNMQVKDKTDYESLIKCLNRIVVNDWGSYTPCQVRMVFGLHRSPLLEVNFVLFAGRSTYGWQFLFRFINAITSCYR